MRGIWEGMAKDHGRRNTIGLDRGVMESAIKKID